jgi:hypothetical protein
MIPPYKLTMSHRQVLVRFTPDGKTPTLLGQPGPEGLSQGTPHGLRIEHEEATGSSFLYHCNNGALLFKTTLDGEILWQTDLSGWKTDPKLQKYTPIVPTDAIVVPGTNHLLVADGYGSSFVHVFDKNTVSTPASPSAARATAPRTRSSSTRRTESRSTRGGRARTARTPSSYPTAQTAAWSGSTRRATPCTSPRPPARPG